jgi:hypothetical protein
LAYLHILESKPDEHGADLALADNSTFYTSTAKGYTDYPALVK